MPTTFLAAPPALQSLARATGMACGQGGAPSPEVLAGALREAIFRHVYGVAAGRVTTGVNRVVDPLAVG